MLRSHSARLSFFTDIVSRREQSKCELIERGTAMHSDTPEFLDGVLHRITADLSWDSSTALPEFSLAAYNAWIENRLLLWSETLQYNLPELIGSLDSNGKARLLNAPECFALLNSTCSPGIRELAAIYSFVKCEQALLDGTYDLPHAHWCALGDYFIEKSKAGSSAIASRMGRSILCLNQIPPAAITLDVASDHLFKGFPTAYGCLQSYGAEYSDNIELILASGYEYVRSYSPFAAQLIGQVLRVIAIVRSMDCRSSIGSVSSKLMIGKAGFLNLHLHKWTPQIVADHLIHEAIHSGLYQLELEFPFYSDQAAADQIRLASPWTGRQLLLHSFIHACFVWFGLWSFWRRCAQGGEQEKLLQSRAQLGFLSRSSLSILPPEVACILNPGMADAIERMFAIVQDKS